MGLRTTTIRTLGNKRVLIPNTRIIQYRVTNYNKYDPSIRIQISVRVPLGSDTEKITGIILASARKHPDVLEEPEPNARIVRFTDSIDIVLFAWIREPAQRYRIKDQLNWEIYKILTENGVQMPLPQREINLRGE